MAHESQSRGLLQLSDGGPGIHHYDIADGKNYFYYHHPIDGRWTVVPWDLDLTWANNMYRSGVTGGDEPFKSRVLSNFGPIRPAPTWCGSFEIVFGKSATFSGMKTRHSA